MHDQKYPCAEICIEHEYSGFKIGTNNSGIPVLEIRPNKKALLRKLTRLFEKSDKFKLRLAAKGNDLIGYFIDLIESTDDNLSMAWGSDT